MDRQGPNSGGQSQQQQPLFTELSHPSPDNAASGVKEVGLTEGEAETQEIPELTHGSSTAERPTASDLKED